MLTIPGQPLALTALHGDCSYTVPSEQAEVPGGMAATDPQQVPL
jgi:hypothetical protein